SQRVLWLLEELGLPYEIKKYQRDAKTYLAPPELRAIHPLGKSPVIEDGDIIVAETGAIVEHLLTTYAGDRLQPPAGSADDRKLTYWLHYAEGSAMTPLLLKLVFGRLPSGAPGFIRPVAKAIAAKAQSSFIDPQLKTHADYWESELAATGWFAGAEFTAADIMMSFPVEAAAQRAFKRAERPALDAFLTAIHARPAYQRALERGGPYSYA
ncbi:MAG: glutathione S-transferase, partial [Brevundimonas sp.]